MAQSAGISVDGVPGGALPCVLLTDYAWPDCEIERAKITQAGFRFVAGPAIAGTDADIEALMRTNNPVAIMTCWAPVSASAIAAASDLRIVARMGVGLDNIAVDAATARGAYVTNVPDYCVEEVSDHATALMLAALRDVPRLDGAVKAGRWEPAAARTERVRDLTVGLIGLGRIGGATARKLAGFGCRVLAVTRTAQRAEGMPPIVDLATLQAEADVIILHLPLTDASRHLVDAAFLAQCARRPWIINVSRGAIIDSAALIGALDSGQIAGAALDVVEGEPSPPSALVGRADVIVTPHVAFFSPSSVSELRTRSVAEVVRVLQGAAPRHACNAPALRQTALTGGIASDISIVDTVRGPIVVKAALARLRVAAEWLSDTSRSLVEANALQVMAELLGDAAVPQVLWIDAETHRFAMTRIDPRLRNWKSDLLAGHVSMDTARRVGTLLGRLHGRSAVRPDIAQRFADTRFFEELRIRPYFRSVQRKNPDLADAIGVAIDNMRSSPVKALVHGDLSPKNILADGADVVLLDCEVAHWGDPRFDLAFCWSHLMLKAMRAPHDALRLEDAAAILAEAYAEEGPAIRDAALTRLLGCLVLARLEGDSPVDYLASLDVPAAKAWAVNLIRAPAPLSSPRIAAGIAA